ncbi:MAG: Acg family FMN-binding oxidoreductase, partial [Thermoanaerobaculia bacterium]
SALMSDDFDPRVTPWQIDPSEFYEIETMRDRMQFLLRYAVLAPSNRNTQPWAFRITDAGVEVFADYTRRLLTIDPDDRELLMSVGAAITNFRVAAARFGFMTRIEYDLRPEEQTPVATITVCETCSPDRHLSSLFGSIPKRHTNRAIFNGKPIDPRALSRLCEVIDLFPETFKLVLPDEKGHVAELIEYAERLQMTRPALRAEIADWIRADDGLHTDGIPDNALGFPQFLASAGSWFVRQFKAGAWRPRRDRHLAESASALLIVSAKDDRMSLLRAGEALEQLLLTIAGAGLQYSFLNHAIEAKTLRGRVQSLSGSKDPPQLLIRIGSAFPVEQATPRRAVESVIAHG